MRVVAPHAVVLLLPASPDSTWGSALTAAAGRRRSACASSWSARPATSSSRWPRWPAPSAPSPAPRCWPGRWWWWSARSAPAGQPRRRPAAPAGPTRRVAGPPGPPRAAPSPRPGPLRPGLPAAPPHHPVADRRPDGAHRRGAGRRAPQPPGADPRRGQRHPGVGAQLLRRDRPGASTRAASSSPPRCRPPVGTRLQVRLGLADGRKIDLDGEVAFVREKSATTGRQPTGCGVKLFGLPGWATESIDRFTQARQPIVFTPR